MLQNQRLEPSGGRARSRDSLSSHRSRWNSSVMTWCGMARRCLAVTQTGPSGGGVGLESAFNVSDMAVEGPASQSGSSTHVRMLSTSELRGSHRLLLGSPARTTSPSLHQMLHSPRAPYLRTLSLHASKPRRKCKHPACRTAFTALLRV
jgi:hypothetical protein